MNNNTLIALLGGGVLDTLIMTLGSTLLGYVVGLPLGIVLTVTDKDGIRPNAPVYKVLDFICNMLRSIPFIILLILLIPITKIVVGKSYGTAAMVFPLFICAAPYLGLKRSGPRCHRSRPFHGSF